MIDTEKSKEQLLAEPSDTRQRVPELERSEAQHMLAEKDLRENYEYAKNLFTASHIPLIVMDAETGAYVDCNEAAVKIYGYANREEVLGKTPLDFSAPTQYDGSDSATEARRHIEAGHREGSHVFEWRHQRTNGQIWDADVHLMFLENRGRPLIQFKLQDITERKKVEKAIVESEETLRSFFDAISEPLLLTDPQGMILMANETMARRLGKSVSELIGLCQYDLFPTDVAHNRKTHYDRVVLTGEPVHFEDGRDGRTFEISAYPVFDEQRAVSKISIYVRDITERKRIEEDLREAEKKFRDLAEKSIVGVYLLQDGIFKYANETLAEILGYTTEELTDKMGPIDVVLPEDLPLLEKNVQRRLSGEIKSLNYEFRTVTKNNNVRNVEVYSSLTTYKGEEAIIGTLLDITDRKQAQEERERLILELKEALAQVKTLSGLLPICAYCKKIRNDQGYWEQMEMYIRNHSEAEFSHGYCPECAAKLLSELKQK
jgi:PAS domain S-box-containing protein